MAALFTATHPAMVERLVLYGSMARFTGRPTTRTSDAGAHAAVVADTWGKPGSAQVRAEPGRRCGFL